jgi:Protein of unknown function (DUF3306)
VEPGESFLRRWSRRKAQTPSRRAQAALPPEEGGTGLPRPAVEPAPTVKTDADMPPLDALDENSDFSGFLSPGVSEELRRLALRKLFHAPKFGVTDGLDDYAADYRRFVPLGEVMTADLRHRIERLGGPLEGVLEGASSPPADSRERAATLDPASSSAPEPQRSAEAAPSQGSERPESDKI